jgi:thioredoxin 1
MPRHVAGSGRCRPRARERGESVQYKVNVDDNPSVSPRFGIRGIPTLILFKDGRETNRLVGLSSKEQIEALVTSQAVGQKASESV